MCEYCGCQQIDVIAELTDEHERLRNLGHELAAAAGAGDLQRARPLAAEMRAVLGPHTQVEEEGLFPALPEQFRERLDELVAEHRSIDAAFDDLDRPEPDAGWPGTIRWTLAHLFDHILKEQDGVFPAALAMLGSAEWDTVAAARARAHLPAALP